MLLAIIAIIASIIAGIGTGLIGLSAATAITPLLIKFNVPVHQAIYLALISDVAASAFTSREYALNGHLVRNNGTTNLPTTWLIFGFTIFFTMIGAFVSSRISERGVGSFACIVSFCVGIKFIIEFLITKPNNDTDSSSNRIIKSLQGYSNNTVTFIATIIGGAIIGLTSGFAGVGGGVTMLLVFRAFGYKLKDAVCVSTLTMIVVALVGGLLHYQLNLATEHDGTINRWILLSICVVTTTISAWITSRLANKSDDRYHKLLCGILLLLALAITKII